MIRSRVYQEVQDHNARRAQTFRGLVKPEGAEAALNDPALQRRIIEVGAVAVGGTPAAAAAGLRDEAARLGQLIREGGSTSD